MHSKFLTSVSSISQGVKLKIESSIETIESSFNELPEHLEECSDQDEESPVSSELMSQLKPTKLNQLLSDLVKWKFA